MNNIVQVVEVTPTPSGQWVTFWYAQDRLRISGEFETDAYVTAFDRGDVYVCLNINDDTMSIVGPHPIDLLKATEFGKLPIIPDQGSYPRHERYSRFDLDRHTAKLVPVCLADSFRESLDGKTAAETLKQIANLH